MVVSTEYLEWQSELDCANRAFAAMIGGQQYDDITREDAERLAGRERTSPAPIPVRNSSAGTEATA